jgi:hypothetical protein
MCSIVQHSLLVLVDINLVSRTESCFESRHQQSCSQ